MGRAATEPIGELSWSGTLVPPAQQPALERPETRSWSGRVASGETGEGQDTFDVVAAATEASPDLRGDHALGCEPTDPALDRPEVLGVVHQLIP